MRCKSEAVHLKSAVRLLVDIKMAFIPTGRKIFRTHRYLVKRMCCASTKKWQKNSRIISGVDLVVGNAAAGGVIAQFAEVVIEAAVLLHHDDDVLQRLQIAARVGDADGCRGRGHVAAGICSRDG